MCCTVTQHKFWFGRWVLTAGFDLTMSSCPASLRRFSSGTKFTEWDSTSGSTGDQLYHALPPPNSFLPHLLFSSTTYYIPMYLKCVAFLSTSPKHSDIPIATFQLSRIVLNNSIFQNRWFHLFFFWIVKEGNSVTCLIASCSSTSTKLTRKCSLKNYIHCQHSRVAPTDGSPAALSPPFFKHSCLWRSATTIWDAEGHMSAILMEDGELVQRHRARMC